MGTDRRLAIEPIDSERFRLRTASHVTSVGGRNRGSADFDLVSGQSKPAS